MISAMILIYLLGAALAFSLPAVWEQTIRRVALAATLLVLGISIVLVRCFVPEQGLQAVERYRWIRSLGVEWFVAVDGISLSLVILTASVGLLVVLISWERERGVGLFYGLVLTQLAGLMGVFTVQNFIPWFFCWEAGLIPAFVMMKRWGGERRHEAAMPFLLFTVMGSLPMLAGMLAVALQANTFDLPTIAQAAASGELKGLSSSVFWMILLGVWVKLPLAPFHSWQADAYVESPPGLTLLFAGVMSKMGLYAMLRLVLPLFPKQLQDFSGMLIAWAVFTVVLSALLASRQRDLKKMMALGSLGHIAFCALALLVLAGAGWGSVAEGGRLALLQGVVLQMIGHGWMAVGLFLVIEMIQRRTGTRALEEISALRERAPRLATVFFFFAMAWIGFPFLSGFMAEVLMLRGVLMMMPAVGVTLLLVLLILAAYTLSAVKQITTGEGSAGPFEDLNGRDFVMLVPLLLGVLWIGVWPGPWLALSRVSLQDLSMLFQRL